MADRKPTINGVDVETIRKVVEGIERRDGLCHPSAFVAASRPKKAPTHGAFQSEDWDDRVAGPKWRTHVARNIIRQVRIEVPEQPAAEMPAFVHVRRVTDEGVEDGYMSTVRALRSDYREAVLDDALKQLDGLRRRYEHLSELSPVWAALDDTTSAVREAA